MGGSFDLSHIGDGACGIPDAGDTIVLTGGWKHNYVTRYDVNGFVEELPQLPENRYGHACGALPATGVRPAQSTFIFRQWWWLEELYQAPSLLLCSHSSLEE